MVRWAAFDAGPIVRDKLRRALTDQILAPAADRVQSTLIERVGPLASFFILRAESDDEAAMERIGAQLLELRRELERVTGRRRR